MTTDSTQKCKSNCDARFQVFISRQEIIDIIKKLYYLLHRTNLPIYYVQAPNLEKYTTTQKDVQEGINRMPP